MIGKTVSHFRILQKLGEGAMGQVYLAQDTDLDRRVALKFLPPTADTTSGSGQRLLQEARLAASLNHPGICTVHEIGETGDGRRFIAMEEISGQPLEQLLTPDGLPAETAVSLIRKIAAGLAHAHAAGIIHRDIKPANIMVTGGGEPKILDFGLARLAAGPRITRPGTVMGTMAYMSPEQVRGDDPDHQSDIWALGVVFYQMLTGRTPFSGEFDAALVYSIAHQDAPPLVDQRSDLDPRLQAIMDRMLARDRNRRYASLEDFLHDLDLIGGADPNGSPTRPRTPSGRRSAGLPGRILWPALIVLTAAVIWAGSLLSRGPGPIPVDGNVAMAVLPLENLSGNPDQDFFAEGFTGELIAGLTRVKGLQVMARNSVLEFRDTDLSVRQIADKLKVDKVVTGTVQQEGGMLRVTM